MRDGELFSLRTFRGPSEVESDAGNDGIMAHLRRIRNPDKY